MLHGCNIGFASEMKFLRLTLDNNVSFSSHVKKKYLVYMSWFIGSMARIRNVVPPTVLLKIYNSYNHSI